MRVQKFGHACLLVEDGDARVLLDPGTFSTGFEDQRGLTAVLVTHQHPDHLDMDRIGSLLAANPDAALHADEGSAQILTDAGHDATAARAGDRFSSAGLAVEVIGRDHAVVHPDIPVIPNVGYLIGGRLFHPGDSFTVPAEPVEILGLPASAPWLKLSEAVDYVRAVGPAVAIPIHERMLANPQMVYGMLDKLSSQATAFTVIDDGKPIDL